MNEALINVETENAVLGTCINESQHVKTAISLGVTPKTFTTKENIAIFKEMQDMAMQRVSIDLVTLSARHPDLNMYLVNLVSSMVTGVMFEEQCADLKRLEAARNLAKGCEKLIGNLNADPFDIDAHVRLQDAMRSAYVQTTAGHKVMMANEAGSVLVDRMQSKQDYTSIPILKSFNKIVFHKKETFVLAADTGSGKTALAAGAVNEMLDAGLSVLYVCGESPSDDILARIVSARCGVPHYKILNRTASRDEYERFQQAFGEIMQRHSKKLAFHCLGNGMKFTPCAIADSAKQLAAIAGGIDVIIVDYLGCLRPDIPVKNDNKTQEVEQIINDLHDFFDDYNAAGFVLCQYSRAGQVEARKGSEPQLNWLRDCGVIENAAHVVAHIVKKPEGDMYLVCNQKYRNIQPFCIQLKWTGATYEAIPNTNANENDVPNEF